jgi:hypothetical protein
MDQHDSYSVLMRLTASCLSEVIALAHSFLLLANFGKICSLWRNHAFMVVVVISKKAAKSLQRKDLARLWGVEDSNLRRLSQQIYSSPPRIVSIRLLLPIKIIVYEDFNRVNINK